MEAIVRSMKVRMLILLAGFKSLWNVVTMMENSLAETKKNLIARIEALSNKPEKIGLINSFFK